MGMEWEMRGVDNVPAPFTGHLVTWPRTTRTRRRRTRRATTVTLKPFYTGMVTAATTSPKVAISVLLVGAISTLIWGSSAAAVPFGRPIWRLTRTASALLLSVETVLILLKNQEPLLSDRLGSRLLQPLDSSLDYFRYFAFDTDDTVL